MSSYGDKTWMQVTAELRADREALESELEGKAVLVAELAETRKALKTEVATSEKAAEGLADGLFTCDDLLQATRAELAKAEARVKELKLLLWRWNADVANTSPVRAESDLARETREALRA